MNYFRYSSFVATVLILLPIIVSCGHKEFSISQTMFIAGENRNELKAVLRHYKEDCPDKEKYLAAKYLIKNISLPNLI